MGVDSYLYGLLIWNTAYFYSCPTRLQSLVPKYLGILFVNSYDEYTLSISMDIWVCMSLTWVIREILILTFHTALSLYKDYGVVYSAVINKSCVTSVKTKYVCGIVSYIRFVSCTSMKWIGLRFGDCGCHLSAVNSLSCTRNHFQMIWAFRHGALFCSKQPSKDGYIKVFIKGCT